MSFTPNGKRMVTAGADERIRFWERQPAKKSVRFARISIHVDLHSSLTGKHLQLPAFMDPSVCGARPTPQTANFRSELDERPCCKSHMYLVGVPEDPPINHRPPY